MKKQKLLSAEYGPTKLGHPFDKLFHRTELVSVKDNLAELRNKFTDADCLVLWGGTDISPSLYGQKANSFCESGDVPSRRDLFEWKLLKMAVAQSIPIIGVCRGAQLLCVFDGGSLAQDIGGHSGSHLIKTYTGATFRAAASHHQMMLPRDCNKLLATAETPQHSGFYLGEGDIIHNIPIGYLEPEAVYFPEINAIGFQTHPEWDHEEGVHVRWALDQVNSFLFKEKVLA